MTGYDPRGWATGSRWDFPAGLGRQRSPASFTTTYTYDSADHLTSIQYPDSVRGLPAETVTTGYDTLGYARTHGARNPQADDLW